jgi:ATP:corrinoid adenosyltransferase
MTWLVLVLVGIAIYVFLRKPNRVKEVENGSQDKVLHHIEEESIFETKKMDVEEDDEIVAAIMVAILAFSGSDTLQVLRIRPSGNNWVLTGRQEQMRGRT